MNAPPQRKIILIAGPNGAGKTTFAANYLTREAACPEFVNADLIARGLAPFAPESAAIAAGKIMLELIASKVKARVSLAIETTLSGRNYVRHIPCWQKAGYHVKLVFLRLSSVELALARVHARVEQGGHAIPDDVVRRRFEAGTRNFTTIYRGIVDSWVLYDNSGPIPLVLEMGDNS